MADQPARRGTDAALTSWTNHVGCYQHNFAATLAANNLAASSNLLQRSLNRLSSGSRIVNPADDAGGMAVSTKLSAAARRQGAAASNLGNAVSYLQTQDGVMKTTGNQAGTAMLGQANQSAQSALRLISRIGL